MISDDDFVAKQVMEKVRVLIFIETSPTNLKDRAKSVKDTWAKRCNKLIFFRYKINEIHKLPLKTLNESEFLLNPLILQTLKKQHIFHIKNAGSSCML